MVENSSAIQQQAAHTSYQLLSISCSTQATPRSLSPNNLLIKLQNFQQKGQEYGPLAEKGQGRKSNRTRQKNKEDRKV